MSGLGGGDTLIDPALDVKSLPNIAELGQTQRILEEQSEKKEILQLQCKKAEDKKWYHIWLAQGILAIAAAGLVAILCYAVNPPITQKKRKDGYTSEKQDWKKVLLFTFFVFLIVLLLPEFIRLVTLLTHKKKPKTR